MADDPTVENTNQTPAEGTPGTSDSGDAAARPAKKAATRKTAAKKATAKTTVAKKTAAKKTTTRKTATKKTTAASADEALALDQAVESPAGSTAEPVAEAEAPVEAPAKKAAAKRTPAKKTAAKKTTTRKTAAKKAAAPATEPAEVPVEDASTAAAAGDAAASGAPGVLFQTPDAAPAPRKRAARKRAAPKPEPVEEPLADEETLVADEAAEAEAEETAAEDQQDTGESAEESEDDTPARRRRRRGGRRRRKSGNDEDVAESEDEDEESAEESEETDESEAATEGGTSRRRRRRRRSGDNGSDDDNPPNTVTRVRESKPLEQQITAVSGSTRLEAKKQRRREGREAGRRRAPIVSEAEFLARRESVERIMVVRQREDLTQIGVIEDKVLVEHYVARESQTSLIGNIYLGRVQNVLPSMEAAFIDIGKGRNAVLYAGEVNWAALGHKEGQPRKIESVLSSGQTVLVQVTKDPIGHKGARLTSQISLAGRFLVYVPDGTTSGISRKLPDTERNRLKTLLKDIVPDTAGVIVRTAAEGASEDELTRDVERLKARWEDIEAKSRGNAPQLLYGEPDLTLKVVRDLFTEDFAKLVVQGDDAWETVKNYVDHVAPDLADRLEKHEGDKDLFAVYRVEEQIAKGLDRKVWLPSGGSLIIDRTEAMTVVDVNTGKFTGSGGNLEETVTKNNLEAAEEIVRQLRLRDIGGIIVVDFIDMVLESNRDLVLRRLVECLGRDRTRHQVAEVTSLGLVQMTRKRIGTGLVEAFSENCTHCQGRGIVIHDHPVESGGSGVVAPEEGGGRRNRRRGGRSKGNDEEAAETSKPVVPSPKDIAQLPRHEADEIVVAGEEGDEVADAEAAVEQAPKVVTRTRGRRGASRRVVITGEDDEVTPAIDADVEVTPPAAAELEAAAEAVVEPSDAIAEAVVDEVIDAADDVDLDTAEAPVEEAPKVVTRSRTRRGASRPVVSTGEGVVVEAAAEPAQAPAPVAVAEAPQPPKVITRTRRGASREVVHAGAADVPAAGLAPDTAMGDGPEGPTAEEEHIEHVPIKKKGTRKR